MLRAPCVASCSPGVACCLPCCVLVCAGVAWQALREACRGRMFNHVRMAGTTAQRHQRQAAPACCTSQPAKPARRSRQPHLQLRSCLPRTGCCRKLLPRSSHTALKSRMCTRCRWRSRCLQAAQWQDVCCCVGMRRAALQAARAVLLRTGVSRPSGKLAVWLRQLTHQRGTGRRPCRTPG